MNDESNERAHILFAQNCHHLDSFLLKNYHHPAGFPQVKDHGQHSQVLLPHRLHRLYEVHTITVINRELLMVREAIH